jgi:hypothetical protein
VRPFSRLICIRDIEVRVQYDCILYCIGAPFASIPGVNEKFSV